MNKSEAIRVLKAAATADGGYLSDKELDDDIIRISCHNCFEGILVTLEDILPKVPWRELVQEHRDDS